LTKATLHPKRNWGAERPLPTAVCGECRWGTGEASLLPKRYVDPVVRGSRSPMKSTPTWTLICLSQAALWGGSRLLAQDASAQSPAPGVESVDVLRPPTLLEQGNALLEIEDPVRAWLAFRDADPRGPEAVDRSVGLGRAHLMLGHSDFAIAYGEHAVAAAPSRQDAMALTIRALIRGREFDEAVRRSLAFTNRSKVLAPDLLAARGSALFRVQRTSDAAEIYRRVVLLEGRHAEAHLRLGSGLLDPVKVRIPVDLRMAVAAMAAGDEVRSIELLLRLLKREPGHPIAHRLLGEALYSQRAAISMAQQDAVFQALAALAPRPSVRGVPVKAFVPGYGGLSESRRLIVERTVAMFAGQLDKLVAVGGRHDLLHELERTTDAESRANLRGRRTFDGRVWDDVRGVGGMRAATGIEALDEAATFGFDTFAHEVAHQVHFFTFTPLQRARIRSLYRTAMAEKRCLDYYAASNEAEYFGQGVEAFASLVKRPGGETTHGHTRFELLRIDPELHDFIAEMVSFDPLVHTQHRADILRAAVAVAIRCGRCDDAVVAAGMLPEGPLRSDLLAKARAARSAQRCH
jgi:tetratricopeptide (TPR) repeat protein